MEYPLIVPKKEVIMVGGVESLAPISPADIIPGEYALELIKKLESTPQAWVFIMGEVLGRATPEELVEWRDGPSGMKLRYVDGAYAIATRAALFRLGIASDLEVTDTHVGANAAETLVKLTFKFFHNGAWSTSCSTQWGECYIRGGMAIGDAMKGAVTDGLKKCLSAFGWAADVYSAVPIAAPPPPSAEEMHLKNLEVLYSVSSGKGLTEAEMAKFIAIHTNGLTLGELKAKDITSLKRKLQKMTEEQIQEVLRDA